MFKQNKKYRPFFLLLATLVFAINTVLNFYGFATKNEGMKLTGGILFGVMTIIYAVDLYGVIKNKKALTAAHE